MSDMSEHEDDVFARWHAFIDERNSIGYDSDVDWRMGYRLRSLYVTKYITLYLSGVMLPPIRWAWNGEAQPTPEITIFEVKELFPEVSAFALFAFRDRIRWDCVLGLLEVCRRYCTLTKQKDVLKPHRIDKRRGQWVIDHINTYMDEPELGAIIASYL